MELAHLNEQQRIKSLQGIFKRDIEENSLFNFRTKIIRPVKGEEPSMQLLFKHLTTEETTVINENQKTYSKRIFEIERSIRLHWIRFHIEERKKENVLIFSVEERDQKKRQDIIRTYIYDQEQRYIIVLDPQRSKKNYYLLTAYYLNKEYGDKKINKLIQKKLPEVY